MGFQFFNPCIMSMVFEGCFAQQLMRDVGICGAHAQDLNEDLKIKCLLKNYEIQMSTDSAWLYLTRVVWFRLCRNAGKIVEQAGSC